MRIKNMSNKPIIWRAFKGDDTSFAVDLTWGRIGKVDDNGAHTSSWRDDSFAVIKVEIRWDHLLQEVLIPPGQKFNITDDLVFDDKTLEVAKVTQESAKKTRSVILKDTQFVDTRGFNKDMTREITSAVENSLTTSQDLKTSHEHAQGWTVKGQFGGNIGPSIPAEGQAGSGSGAKFGLSVEFQDSVTDFLQKSYSEQVSSVWSRTVRDTMTFEPGSLYAVEVFWSVIVEEGAISYFGERSAFSVVKSADGNLTKPTRFKSEDEMSADLRATYNALKGTKTQAARATT